MNLPAAGWSNKVGTSSRACVCGTWAQHWVKYARAAWPASCSVLGCCDKPTVGGHVINPHVAGERIVPLCGSCNAIAGAFTLKGGILLPSANRAETCGSTGYQ